MFSFLYDICKKDIDPWLPLTGEMTFFAPDLALILTWWASFEESEQMLFEHFFGGLLTLASVTIPEDFLQAMQRYWLPQFSLFRFGQVEMTLSLEECQLLLGMHPGLTEIATCVIDKLPRTYFSQLSGVRRNWINAAMIDGVPVLSIQQVISLFDSTPPITFTKKCRFTTPSETDSMNRRKVLSLGFVLLSGLCFPRVDGLLDLRTSFYIVGVIGGKTVIPAILAEIFRGISIVHFDPPGYFCGCAELLYIWLAGHVFQRGSRHFSWFHANPLRNFVHHLSQIPRIPKDLLGWHWVLDRITSDSIVWNLGLPRRATVVTAGAGLDFLPLVGLHGVVPYFGRRILRQAGGTQIVPRDKNGVPFERFYFDFFLRRFQPLVSEAEDAWLHLEKHESLDFSDFPWSSNDYESWIQSQIERPTGAFPAPQLL